MCESNLNKVQINQKSFLFKQLIQNKKNIRYKSLHVIKLNMKFNYHYIQVTKDKMNLFRLNDKKGNHSLALTEKETI